MSRKLAVVLAVVLWGVAAYGMGMRSARAEFDPGALIGRILHIAGHAVEIRGIASVGDHDFQVLVHVQ